MVNVSNRCSTEYPRRRRGNSNSQKKKVRRSIARSEMRPFIKQIEALKAENYLFEKERQRTAIEHNKMQEVNKRLEEERRELTWKLEEETERAASIEYAKGMLSESLREMIEDYQKLRGEYEAEKSRLLKETRDIKAQFDIEKKEFKKGMLQVANTAKAEITRVLKENYLLKEVLEQVIQSKDARETKPNPTRVDTQMDCVEIKTELV
jgi:phosphoglycolate phosphatase-like HAD superfamily hydrolase